MQELLAREQVDHAHTRYRLEHSQQKLIALRRRRGLPDPVETPPEAEAPQQHDRDPSQLHWPALTTAERRLRLGI